MLDINQQPVLTGITSSTVSENNPGAVIGTVLASDPDSRDTLQYSVDDIRFEVDGESLKLNNDESLDFEQESLVSLLVQVTDDNGLSNSQAVDVIVSDENDAPIVVTPLSAMQLDTDTSLTLNAGTFSDQDNDVLTYSVTNSNGQPIPDWVVFDATTTELSLGEIPAESVTEQLILTADDGRGGTAQILFFVRFEPEPTPELESALPTDESQAFDLDIDFTIPNREDLTLQLQQSEFIENTQPVSALGNGFSESTQSLATEDSIEAAIALRSESSTDLFDRLLAGLSDEQSNSNHGVRALQDSIISDYLANRVANKLVTSELLSGFNAFDYSVSLAALFAAAGEQDTEMFASLSDDFNTRRDEVEAQVLASRKVIGSSITVTTGLSIGYFLYLLRGGAIMSSMLASLPAWRFVDPLPILGDLKGSLDSDEESLQSMVSKNVD